MQPLKTAVRPNRESTIGWLPDAERSMTLRRRCASATGPCAQAPPPSGPRSAMVAAMTATAATSAWPSKQISPARPHMRSRMVDGDDVYRMGAPIAATDGGVTGRRAVPDVDPRGHRRLEEFDLPPHVLRALPGVHRSQSIRRGGAPELPANDAIAWEECRVGTEVNEPAGDQATGDQTDMRSKVRPVRPRRHTRHQSAVEGEQLVHCECRSDPLQAL